MALPDGARVRTSPAAGDAPGLVLLFDVSG